MNCVLLGWGECLGFLVVACRWFCLLGVWFRGLLLVVWVVASVLVYSRLYLPVFMVDAVIFGWGFAWLLSWVWSDALKFFALLCS